MSHSAINGERFNTCWRWKLGSSAWTSNQQWSNVLFIHWQFSFSNINTMFTKCHPLQSRRPLITVIALAHWTCTCTQRPHLPQWNVLHSLPAPHSQVNIWSCYTMCTKKHHQTLTIWQCFGLAELQSSKRPNSCGFKQEASITPAFWVSKQRRLNRNNLQGYKAA